MAEPGVLVEVVLIDRRCALDGKPDSRAVARSAFRSVELVGPRFPEMCGTRYDKISNALRHQTLSTPCGYQNTGT